MNKQTAVEWLWEQIDGIIPYQDINTNQRFIGVLEQAKTMEKEQIEDAYEIGFADGWDESRYNNKPHYTSSTNYYEETYKKAAEDK